MQALTLPAAAGWQWIRSGWQLFRKQPIAFATLVLSLMFAALLFSVVVSAVEQVLLVVLPRPLATLVANGMAMMGAMLSPGLSVGFMQACRVAESGAPVYPHLLVQPFLVGRSEARALLMLGLIQVIALSLVAWATSGFSPDLSAAYGADGKLDLAKLSPDMKTRMAVGNLVVFAASVPVIVLLWYAPALVAWHRIRVLKAVFFSIAACWRNRAAFVIYFCGWVAVLMIPTVIFTLFGVLGMETLGTLLVVPIVVAFVTWMYCSFYTSYTTVFVASPDATPVETSSSN